MMRTFARLSLLPLLAGSLLLGACGDDASTTGEAIGAGSAGEGAPLVAASVGQVTESAVFADACIAQGDGADIGNKVGDITLQNCLGEPVALHDFCGRRKAMWFINSAGWCGACESYVPQASAMAQQRRHEGIELYVLVGEDSSGANATQEYCMQYAQTHNLDPAHTLFDSEQGFYGMWSVISPGGGGTVGLPFEAVLDPYDMSYVWNNAQGGDVSSVLNELVSH